MKIKIIFTKQGFFEVLIRKVMVYRTKGLRNLINFLNGLELDQRSIAKALTDSVFKALKAKNSLNKKGDGHDGSKT